MAPLIGVIRVMTLYEARNDLRFQARGQRVVLLYDLSRGQQNTGGNAVRSLRIRVRA